MSWRTEWKAISERIEGLLAASSFFLQIKHDDPHCVISRELRPAAVRIFESVRHFRDAYQRSLSPPALSCLDDFIQRSKVFYSPEFEPIYQPVVLQVLITTVVLFQSEFSFYLSDTQAIGRRLTERAFVHLKRSIVADPHTRERWNKAFETSEIECERLGAIHLLYHGVWAFKVNAEGGRTDLVLGDQMLDLTEVESTAEALVLTEWKTVRDPNQSGVKAAEALAQAKSYAEGILGGIELARYRYLVLVSEQDIEMPPDVPDGDVVYKHVNIPVNPQPPSVNSRKLSRSGKGAQSFPAS